MNKICSKCRLEKDTKEFYVNRKSKDGLYCQCIRCVQSRNKTIIDRNNKKCSKCGLEKSLELFNIDISGLKGKCVYCKECQGSMSTLECRKDITRRYKKTEKGKEVNIKSKIRNKVGALWYAAKKRAEVKNLEFNLSKGDIIIPEVCPVLGIPIINSTLQGHTNNSPSIDRIDNSKGYVKGNVCVISWRANVLKNSGTIEEHKKIVAYMEKHFTKEQS